MNEIVPDNYDLFRQRDADQEQWLAGRPKCICCGEAIQEDSAVQIRGDYYCDRCLDDMRVYIED
nr:MAG TPA: DEAD-box ATP-dependent RNA helicase [Caudoviricetes sp.]